MINNTDDLRESFGKPIHFSCKNEDEAFTDDYVLFLEKKTIEQNILIKTLIKLLVDEYSNDDIIHFDARTHILLFNGERIYI